MKKVITMLAIVIMAATQAKADAFLDDFNLYAETMYSIPAIETVIESVSYRSESVEITTTDEVIIVGHDPMAVISAACCALRTIDNAGSMIDQYGRVLNAFFINQVHKKETRATTESGVLIYFSEHEGTFTIRLVTH